MISYVCSGNLVGDMFSTLSNMELHAALNINTNVSYTNKHIVHCYTAQAINALTGVTQAKQIHRKKWSENKLCNTNRYRKQLTNHPGSHMGTLRHRQTGRQTEPFFQPVHQHSSHFKIIMVLWALNSGECQQRAKQTVPSDLLWSSKPSKATQSSSSTRLPGLHQPAISNLSQTQRLPAMKWHQNTGNSFSLPFTGVYVSMCVVK